MLRFNFNNRPLTLRKEKNYMNERYWTVKRDEVTRLDFGRNE